MRLAICGVKGIGKTKLVDEFIKNWPTYKKSDYTKVENIIKTKDLSNLEVQREILDAMTDVAMEAKRTDNIFHDGCTIDSICKAFYLAAKNTEMKESDIDMFIQKIIMLTKQSLHFYDIVFYIPYNTKFTQLAITDTQKELNELDNFYQAIQDTYTKNIDWIFPFNDLDGSPPMIEIFGGDEERLQMIKLYVNPDGNAYAKEDSLLNI